MAHTIRSSQLNGRAYEDILRGRVTLKPIWTINRLAVSSLKKELQFAWKHDRDYYQALGKLALDAQCKKDIDHLGETATDDLVALYYEENGSIVIAPYSCYFFSFEFQHYNQLNSIEKDWVRYFFEFIWPFPFYGEEEAQSSIMYEEGERFADDCIFKGTREAKNQPNHLVGLVTPSYTDKELSQIRDWVSQSNYDDDEFQEKYGAEYDLGETLDGLNTILETCDASNSFTELKINNIDYPDWHKKFTDSKIITYIKDKAVNADIAFAMDWFLQNKSYVNVIKTVFAPYIDSPYNLVVPSYLYDQFDYLWQVDMEYHPAAPPCSNYEAWKAVGLLAKLAYHLYI